MRNRWWWLAVVFVLLLALALRVHNIRHLSLTNDEVAEVTWSSKPFDAMMDEVKMDMVHPPLDYILQHTIGLAAPSDWARRVPPVLFGTATVGLVIALGTLWCGRLAGLLAGLFLAIAPLHVRFSQEIRPYSMALFFTTAAVVALELYARRRRVVWAVAWFFGVFLAALTFYFAGMTAGVVSLARIYIDRRGELRQAWRRLPLFFAGWALLYAFWIPVAMNAMHHAPPFPPDRLNWTWWRYRLDVFGAGDLSSSHLGIGSILFWLAVASGIVLSRRERFLQMAVVWFAICGAIEIVALHYRPHYSAARHLMPAWIGAVILAGAGTAHFLRQRRTIVVAALIALGFVIPSGSTLAAYYRSGRPDWRAVAEFVHGQMKPGDTLIATNNWAARNLGYYWERMPRIPGTHDRRFELNAGVTPGPLWVVSAQCTARPELQRARLIRRFPVTDIAEVRFLPAGQSLSNSEEWCPE